MLDSAPTHLCFGPARPGRRGRELPWHCPARRRILQLTPTESAHVSVRVRLTPSDHVFTVEQGETILAAALRSGLALPFGCANGSCGECKAKVIAGDAERVGFHDYTFRESEKRSGFVLLCCTTARSDLVVQAPEAAGAGDIPHQSLRARVSKLIPLNEDVVLLDLRVQRGRVLRFLAGQYVSLAVSGSPGAGPWNQPIASCPCDGLNLEFHLRRETHGPLVDRLQSDSTRGPRIDIEGPHGGFILDESSSRPVIFLAKDAEFAPIRSLLEHAVNLELEQPLFLYWYASAPDGHYQHNYCRSLQDALDNVSYTRVVGENPEAGRAQTDGAASSQLADRILTDHPDVAGFDVYAAGPQAFLSAVEGALGTAGLRPERFFSDSPEGRS